MAKKKYWQSFKDLNKTELSQDLEENEFREELPFETADSKGLTNTPASRRDFLKYLGFSTAAAVAAAAAPHRKRHQICGDAAGGGRRYRHRSQTTGRPGDDKGLGHRPGCGLALSKAGR